MRENSGSPTSILHHPWKVPLKRAAVLQGLLARYVRLTPLHKQPRLVAGIDSAQHENDTYVAIVTMDIKAGKIIEIQCSESGVVEPSINVNGYQAFRDGATILKAYRRLYHEPDLLLFSGHGICHPRLCGVASHIGLRLEKPAIGCARTRLVGQYDPPGPKSGDYSVIRYSPQASGAVLRTREGAKPLYVSPGHRIDLLGAIEQCLRCCTRYRVPEPLRRAHIEAGRFMRLKLAQK